MPEGSVLKTSFSNDSLRKIYNHYNQGAQPLVSFADWKTYRRNILSSGSIPISDLVKMKSNDQNIILNLATISLMLNMVPLISIVELAYKIQFYILENLKSLGDLTFNKIVKDPNHMTLILQQSTEGLFKEA